jgi:hypothetical protein
MSFNFDYSTRLGDVNIRTHYLYEEDINTGLYISCSIIRLEYNDC